MPLVGLINSSYFRFLLLFLEQHPARREHLKSVSDLLRFAPRKQLERKASEKRQIGRAADVESSGKQRGAASRQDRAMRGHRGRRDPQFGVCAAS